MSQNVVWHDYRVSKEIRSQRSKCKPCMIWLTGLSGSGKSTIANVLESKLFDMGINTYLLDGDNVRHGLCKDLGFTQEDRDENNRRVAEVGKLMVDAGLVVISCFISPSNEQRSYAREILEDGEFIEVYVNCDLETCKSRDPKGLYKKALAGEIKNFTGIDAPYEAPKSPEITIRSDRLSPEGSTLNILDYLNTHSYFKG